MLFNSYDYIFVFLPISVAVYYCLLYFSGDKLISILNTRMRVVWLVVASLYFYSYWSARYLPLLLFSAIINFIVGRSQERNVTHARAWLVAGVVFNLALLSLFKYVNFAVAQLDLLLGLKLPQTHILLPIGISFFTFTQIAYLVDVSRGVAGRYDIWRYVLFVTFFPHLIAGPILHHSEMMPQFAQTAIYHLSRQDRRYGLTIFCDRPFQEGLSSPIHRPLCERRFRRGRRRRIRSVRCSTHGAGRSPTRCSSISISPATPTWRSGWRACSVSKLPLNFDSPYKAVNIIDFWRRWHMTLVAFLARLSLHPSRRQPAGRAAALRESVAHHAARRIVARRRLWTFVIWGGLHGALLA